MKHVSRWLARYHRGGLIGLGATVLLAVSYFIAVALHQAAIEEVDAAKRHIAQSDWIAAIRCLDTALWEDRFLSPEVYLLRGTAINESINVDGKWPFGHSREDSLTDVERYLRYRPASGEAHYQRGCILVGLAKKSEAREAFAEAIRLLPDPTKALFERSFLSHYWFSDRATAIKEITSAIERQPLVAEYYDQRACYRLAALDRRGASLDRAKAARLRANPNRVTVQDLEVLERERRDQPVTAPQDATAVIAELSRFRGGWRGLATESQGKMQDVSKRLYVYAFDDDRYSVFVDDWSQPEESFRLDPSHERAWIDLVRTVEDRTVTLLGIYEFHLGRLRLCIADEGEPRPKEFATEDLVRGSLLTFRSMAGRIARPPLPGGGDNPGNAWAR
ncbi:TIGR03067 domain-containing protein [Singulisphaera sp. Ch08]|uniref:TIGR03067 domain-containing protein n=1 Tax=Singulisphaera sp. Ch08 TaxID=3120278 RepID=A0AAU7CK08_9BACT